MPSRKDRLIVLYPEYFTAKYTRAEGRRVPKSLAKPAPTIEDLEKAARSLGLNPIVEKNKSYPRYWYKKRGRILVEKKMSKSELLKAIGKALPK